MEIIYLAIASIDYEGYDVIKAFKKGDKAEAFIQECKEYDNKTSEREKPEDETYKTDERDKYFSFYDERANKHPAGPYGNSDGYHVITATLDV